MTPRERNQLRKEAERQQHQEYLDRYAGWTYEQIIADATRDTFTLPAGWKS